MSNVFSTFVGVCFFSRPAVTSLATKSISIGMKISTFKYISDNYQSTSLKLPHGGAVDDVYIAASPDDGEGGSGLPGMKGATKQEKYEKIKEKKIATKVGLTTGCRVSCTAAGRTARCTVALLLRLRTLPSGPEKAGHEISISS